MTPDRELDEPMSPYCDDCQSSMEMDAKGYFCPKCKEFCEAKAIELILRKTSQKDLQKSIEDYERHEVSKIVVRLSHYHPNSIIRVTTLSGQEYTFEPKRDKNGK